MKHIGFSILKFQQIILEMRSTLSPIQLIGPKTTNYLKRHTYTYLHRQHVKADHENTLAHIKEGNNALFERKYTTICPQTSVSRCSLTIFPCKPYLTVHLFVLGTSTGHHQQPPRNSMRKN
ncbi:uncharacterized protein LAJ45_06915 [Morchella importuna]|uniref:uncharacterized protein n=1 Tax=Morchella importuna TaxID=1174673 RepID=UPI001E8EEC8A|nr:uncharacterized protein LAJ45_06915 [Morchella importuna]KAH8148941.1 hypothetical protein LAJ45_06915 [Morchella importuna]